MKNIVRLQDVPPVSWRNGGGTTRELLAWPSAAGWQMRISIAEVASDGPFSNFAGLERWFAVLQGEGVRLAVDGVVHELRAGSLPLRFDGGAQVDARLLGGPTLDFNLMAAPGVATLERRGACLHVHSRVLEAVYHETAATLMWKALP